MATRANPDGRVIRGIRSRLAVAEAMLGLINEGQLRPPLRAVAERAEVSLRLVHNHFADREQLFAAAASLQMERLARYVKAIAPELPLDRRLEAFIRSRAKLLEAITPVRRAAVGEEAFSTALRQSLDAIRDAKRKQVVSVFAPELAAVTGATRKDVTRALCAAVSWSMWEQLRSHQNLSVAAARRTLALMLRTLLSAHANES